ncbi:MAG: serine O-acetyltransferase [Cytophagaceae bacterium]|jgi:serine O-acetyltransferase|nr:serine O-acetyltransferase [Cytophagaceae bacterium]
MEERFLQDLLNKHQRTEHFPSTSSVCRLVSRVLLILFPEQTKNHFTSTEEIQQAFVSIESDLRSMLHSMQSSLPAPADSLTSSFMKELPYVYELLTSDIDAALAGDPAAKSEFEIIRTYPGFYAIAFFRLANILHRLQVPILPRALTEYAHSKTGIDIHPGATVGSHFFIDHGTGIVIGETAHIGNHVKIYQCVTLGALSVSKDMASQKRHPTIEDYVVIYAGATILGGETTIGHHSVVGGNVWLTRSIAPYTKIYHQEQVKIIDNG